VTYAAPFIVLEGPEGAGKSQQAGILSAWLREQGWEVVQTREPGGTAAGDAIRAILLQSDDLHLLPETEALLMTAARAQHVRETVRPALEQGRAVVCDRYVDSTYAYQGGGSEIPLERLQPLQDFATDGMKPNIRFLLDVPVEIGLARRHGEAAQVNRIDRAPVDFHQRVRAAFLQLADAEPDNWAVIDATASIEDVSRSIRAAVEARLPAFAGGGKPT
jgi:dTMP kinase